ncbi:hypothetical protein J2752_002633 [Halarchaeum rubridurum]|uniref:site-specific DNA-methyltransferase (adenine-specific) n=1 Tax=Halarchaeum rubridurum TaxID=489911 RepID=A0A830G3U8_9EURY|nr:TaqI-like C-terminal specificity domain-containing protein [Halarchaeum rubridurum]MBP1955704.1 hypothetical protein [Halarchaeum rubridurum]GGM74015.1 hypothetical protein GCM10009017_25000 [Halarchaeum rubridurum]
MTESTIYRTNRDLFSNHYLDDHLRDTEPWNEVTDAEVEAAFEEINELLTEKRDRVEDYNEAQLERNVIRPIFDILGVSFEIEETVMRNSRRPDYGFFPSAEAADAAFDREDFYEEATAVADAKRWGRKLDTRGEEKRDFENPSYQIHRYLQETPPQWAVLTNGEKWRLYYGPTSHRLDSFYEIDLPKLLDAVDDDGDLEAFKEFYLFFRHEAFLPDQSGDCFLDDVYDESSLFAEDLGEELQENIYEAIRVLAEGFLDTNDGLDEADLELVHDSSLIYLYRLIFVLYAESEGRNLLPTDNEIYSGSYSLNDLKRTVVENRSKTQQQYQAWQTNLWDRLEELFVLIDQGSQGQGIPKEDLYIPAYNGGLFRTNPDADDSVESQFLASHEVGDAYIAEVIELLTRHEASEGDGKVFVDYSSLDERNLGSIYEGLLEYKLDVAAEPLTVDDGEYVTAEDGDAITVEEGEVYLRTDDGERKATGSYYTPEYVVEYIVDETLGPLVDEIREDMLAESARGDERGFAKEFADRVFDLTVLDPAMGSGHFPVNAVDYLAREIINAQEQQDRQALDSEDAEIRSPTTEEGELRDINWARRKVAQRCIYGVDVNPLATELAKVSLWLRTLAAEQPLAFLDHHLKTGNSLVGSDIEEVLSDEDDGATEDGQLTLQQSFDHTRKRAMKHVTDRFQDLLTIDNETLEDAKKMEAVYDDVREDPLYRKLLAMANVHTADAFGLDVPDDADERMARALHSEAWEKIEQQDWFKSAQAMAEEERFFHWELEFPTAFYDQDGSRKADAGFDAVIGNPPYSKHLDSQRKDYFNKVFTYQNYQLDQYLLFIEKIIGVKKPAHSRAGIITPNTWLTNLTFDRIRDLIFGEQDIESFITYSEPVFPEVTVEPTTIIFSSSSSGSQNIRIRKASDGNIVQETTIGQEVLWDGSGSVNISTNLETISIKNKLSSHTRLSDICEINLGTKPFQEGKGNPPQTKKIVENKPFVSEEKETEDFRPLLRGSLIDRYIIKWDGEYWIEFGDWLAEPRYSADYDADKKIVTRQTGDSLISTVDEEQFIVRNNMYTILPRKESYNIHLINALYNSKFLNWYYQNIINPEKGETLAEVRKGYLVQLPLPEEDNQYVDEQETGESQLSTDLTTLIEKQNIDSYDKSCLCSIIISSSKKLTDFKNKKFNLNTNLLDYLGNYADGPDLPDIGLFQPTGSNILDATTEEYEKLQIQRARTKRDGSTVTIEATARYKPEDEDEFETDTYGYTETEFHEAFTLTNLSDEEAALVEAFVPVAVDEEVGGFRDNATKTNSLIDRLKGMTLPDPDDVADDLQRYIETKERADELDEKIEKTDQLIDEIVYDLYDLTDEEIEIVEEAVADN